MGLAGGATQGLPKKLKIFKHISIFNPRTLIRGSTVVNVLGLFRRDGLAGKSSRKIEVIDSWPSSRLGITELY